jgi:hypothetical protein
MTVPLGRSRCGKEKSFRPVRSYDLRGRAVRTTHTGIIDEDEAQVGTVAVKRYSCNEMQFLINFTGQDAQAIALRGRTLEIYWESSKLLPRLKTTTGSF